MQSACFESGVMLSKLLTLKVRLLDIYFNVWRNETLQIVSHMSTNLGFLSFQMLDSTAVD